MSGTPVAPTAAPSEYDRLLALPPALDDDVSLELLDPAPIKRPSRRVFVVAGFSILFIVFVSVFYALEQKPATKPLTILLSLDGTRPQYLELGLTPTLALLRTQGAASAMIPSFPSVTFPNHFTLTSGVYPEIHGIVGNSFFDPALNQSFSYQNPVDNGDGRWWDRIEPIWISATKRGLLTATCFWPGSEAPYHGIRPTYWKKFNYVDISIQLKWIFDWIDLPLEHRPDFITIYLPQIDGAGHTAGPDSADVNATLALVDAKIGELVFGLVKRGLYDSTNLIVVSDHGMAATSTKKVVFFDDYSDPERYHVIINGPLVSLYPSNPKDTPDIYQDFVGGAKASGHFQVWLHDDIPDSFHYNNPRVGPIVLLGEM
ncbi:hypothetical protein HDU91_002571, partial [Kappamyces sp. JEL0680]